MQILLFAKCDNSAISSWHVFIVLLTSQHLEITAVEFITLITIINTRCLEMCYSTDFLVCINIAPRNNGCGVREISMHFSNSFREFSVKFGTF